MILEINESAKPILAFIGKIFNIIHIAVPILLIVFITFDLVKAVLSQDEEIVSKTVRNVRNRTIAALLIFFLPTFVDIIFNNVFVALNMNEEEYIDIINSYKYVIDSSSIVVDDESKNNEISSNLNYEMTSSSKTDFKSEATILNISRTLTKYLFNDNKPTFIFNDLITDDFKISYNDTDYGISDKFIIVYDELKSKEVLFNDNEIISSITLKNARINSINLSDVSLNYIFKKVDDTYKLDRVNIVDNSTINQYISKLNSDEVKNDSFLAEKYTSKNTSYDYSKLNDISDDVLKNIYDSNYKNVVMLSSVIDGASVNRAVGFFVNNGVIATSWSYIKSSLMNNQTIVISDVDNNSYKIDGVVAIDVITDIVAIKLDKNVTKSVKLNDAEIYNNDPVAVITSKNGISYSVVSGIVSSVSNSIINVLPLSKTDWGSPLFNINGEVIGINTSKFTDTELSNASLITGLLKLQSELKSVEFNNIKIIKLEELKKQYYYKDDNKEEIKTSIPKKIWDKYKHIGDVDNSIILDLVKASYYNKVVSLRYLNESNEYLSNISFATDFISNLKKDGYENIYETKEKIVFKKGFNKVVIMSEFDYLVVIIAREGII